MRYALIDQNNVITALIVWDGIQPYQPADGLRLERIDESIFCDSGWIWTPNGPQPPPEAQE
jgi:hypothetical protein